MKVYLSGPIYTQNTPEDREATDGWRNEVDFYFRSWNERSIGFVESVTKLENYKFIETIDPCRKKAIYDPKIFTPNEIVLRDLKDVKNADIILVNFNLIGNKLPIGTVMEVMYAWNLGKPVVIVSTDNRIINHPWLIAMSVRIFDDLKTACDYIVEFWA